MDWINPKTDKEILENLQNLTKEKRYNAFRQAKNRKITKKFYKVINTNIFHYNKISLSNEYWIIIDNKETCIYLQSLKTGYVRKVQWRFLFTSYRPVYKEEIQRLRYKYPQVDEFKKVLKIFDE